MRKNKSQRDQRRAHLHAKLPRLSTDSETGSTHLRHRIDLKTGMYRGRQVLNVNSNSRLTTDDPQQSNSDDQKTKTKSAEKEAAAS
jgi:large subunit ribosomal protein L32